MDISLDGRDAKARDEVRILWVVEQALPDAIEATPELDRIEPGDGVDLIPLHELART